MKSRQKYDFSSGFTANLKKIKKKKKKLDFLNKGLERFTKISFQRSRSRFLKKKIHVPVPVPTLDLNALQLVLDQIT